MKLTRQLLTVGLALLFSPALASAIPGRAEVKRITGTATVGQGAGAATTLAEGGREREKPRDVVACHSTQSQSEMV